MSAINVVLLADCLENFQAGAEKQVLDLARGLDKEKYNVTVASLECLGVAPRAPIEEAGCRLAFFPVKRIYGLSGLREGLRFLKFLKKEQIDVLMTYHFSSDIWGPVWGRLAGVRRIISNRRDMGFWRGKHHIWAYKLINRRVDKIIVNAMAIKEKFMREEGLPGEKVEVIYNGVKLDSSPGTQSPSSPGKESAPVPQDPSAPANHTTGTLGNRGTGEPIKKETKNRLRQELNISPDDIIIMHVANLRPVKGHEVLLKAFAATIRQDAGAPVRKDPSSPARRIKLVLIGDGELRKQLERLAGSLGLWESGTPLENKVIFLGRRPDVRDLLAAADICVLPSLSEGLSNAVLEYMAAGKPVVATRVGGTPEMVQDGFNGVLVDPEDADGLAQALSALARDPRKRREMGANSLEKVREFGMERMVARYEEVFTVPQCARAPGAQGKSAPLSQFPSDPGKESAPVPQDPSAPANHTTGTLGPWGTGGPIKILHLISSGGLFGAEQILLTLCRHFNGDKYASVAGALHNRHNPHLEVVFKAKEEGLPYKIFDCQGRVDLMTIWRIRRFVREAGIDLIHTHNYKSNMVGLIAGKLAGVPVTATAHGFTDMDRRVSFYEKTDRIILKLFFDRIIVVAPSVLPGVPATKKRVIPNGIDMNRFMRDERLRESIRAQFRVALKEILIGTVGRISREKNQILLLKAAYPLLRDRKVKMVIVGDGELREELSRYITDRHLEDRVILTGLVPDVFKVYQALDIFALPSLTEGVPLTVLEAMASGLPVIATAVGGVPQIVRNGQNGVLVPSGNEEAFREGLEHLLKDAGTRSRLAEAGMRHVREHCTVGKMIDGYENIYREIF